MIFDANDWNRLATLFDGVHPLGPIAYESCLTGWTPYPGYNPETVEAPNGDTKVCPNCDGGTRRSGHPAGAPSCSVCHGSGRVPNADAADDCSECEGRGWNRGKLTGHALKCSQCAGTGRVPNVDAGPAGKRYLHVAEKYLAKHPALEWPREYLARAHYELCRVARALGVPAAYWPSEQHTTLRVLEYPSAGHRFADFYTDYPCEHCGVLWGTLAKNHELGTARAVCPALAPGAGTAEHTDFDLFTIVCWRETPRDLERLDAYEEGGMGVYPERLDTVSPGLHIGEIGELVGIGPATPHRVPARPYVQRSIVAFAIPDHAARLPGTTRKAPFHTPGHYWTDLEVDVPGPTVGEWLHERMARSRVAAGGYK
jgi:hypothetical protein